MDTDGERRGGVDRAQAAPLIVRESSVIREGTKYTEATLPLSQITAK